MPTSGFHSEWVTIGKHRILLECRTSFPDDHMRFVAKVAATTCDANSEGRARVVQVYFDDRSSITTTDVASDDERDRGLASVLMAAFQAIFNNGNYEARAWIIPKHNSELDAYNRTEYLSIAARVSVDPWKQDDPEYHESIRAPR